MILIKILLFVLGLILLVKGSDFFVRSSASLAKKFGVSEFIIGLTLVALGTSIPELASAIMASIKQASGLVIGNIAGANIANIGLITGIAATIAVIKTNEEMLKRDGYIMLLAAFLFLIFIFNGVITRIEACILLLLYIAYVIFLVERKPRFKGKYHFKEFVTYFFNFRYVLTIRSRIIAGLNSRKNKRIGPTEQRETLRLFRAGIIKDFLIMILGGVAVAYGARFFINGALSFANFINIPQSVIGVSIVSIGTTLPELSVTISAARKGFGNIALGNVIGSCITNIFLILGIAALISPLPAVRITLIYILPFLMLMSILLLVFIKSHWEIRKFEGITFVTMYIIFLIILFYKSII